MTDDSTRRTIYYLMGPESIQFINRGLNSTRPIQQNLAITLQALFEYVGSFIERRNDFTVYVNPVKIFPFIDCATYNIDKKNVFSSFGIQI